MYSIESAGIANETLKALKYLGLDLGARRVLILSSLLGHWLCRSVNEKKTRDLKNKLKGQWASQVIEMGGVNPVVVPPTEYLPMFPANPFTTLFYHPLAERSIANITTRKMRDHQLIRLRKKRQARSHPT
jgi:hypothetical protein